MADSTKQKKPIQKKVIRKKEEPTALNQLMPYILGFVAIFLGACFIIKDNVGYAKYVGVFLCGLFSYGAFFVPILLLYLAVFYSANLKLNVHRQKWVYMILIIIFISVTCSLFNPTKGYNISNHYTSGISLNGGGVAGGYLYNILSTCIGTFGVGILSAISLIVFVTLLFGKTPIYVFSKISSSIKRFFKFMFNSIKEAHEKDTAAEADDSENYTKKSTEIPSSPPSTKTYKKKKFDIDIPVGEQIVIDDVEEPLLELENKNEKMPKEVCDPEVERDINDTLTNIFVSHEPVLHTESTPLADHTIDKEAFEAEATVENVQNEHHDEPITVKKEEIITDTEPSRTEPVYKFPPISLLKKESRSQFESDKVYEQTGKKLVETLRSFKVNTEIIHISKGPAITRYELKPERGIKVKSITNLADDIALNLAATGVRIEAPIPGQEAVGVEIPNKNVSTVYVRELIENEAFESSKSKLTTCLGMNVAGSPIYCDISKMPHLLIAGATGMGKSVCINSLIVSMLYKASPEELKLILVDPKKVELSIYNGIPHLLVPVVSDPKKAAGALCWAVSEMERRFALIEEVGVRDIKSYNEVVKSYEDHSPLPHIVIIIDELADLMMMARDDVESSICRLAQKARAAGMHLIIGTQRPSVDVITGLIKANIPSRIAFTVASQIDSRTIIDISGAEKLIGRGDMLYAPVGLSKPLRVQGAFVSEGEVEAVTEFIKNSEKAEYSNEVIESIELEAARCGEKKSKSGGNGSGKEGGISLNSDEMLKPAIEVALESGSISASLLQRRLSLGYARAARLIDNMYELGIVGPFSGAKPRQLLISRERYNEMLMHSDDE